MNLFLIGMEYGIEEIYPHNLVFLMFKDNPCKFKIYY
jgi:hypothetical protein